MFALNPLTTCFRQTHTLIADRLPHANHVAVIAEQTFYTLTDSSTLMGRAIKCLSFGALIGAITYPFIPYILPPEESDNARLYAIAYAAVVAYKSWVDETDEQRIKRLIANLLNPTNDTNQPQPAHSTEQSSVQRRAANEMESHALIPALYRRRNAVSSIYPETSSHIPSLVAKTFYRASSPLQAIIACNSESREIATYRAFLAANPLDYTNPYFTPSDRLKIGEIIFISDLDRLSESAKTVSCRGMRTRLSVMQTIAAALFATDNFIQLIKSHHTHFDKSYYDPQYIQYHFKLACGAGSEAATVVALSSLLFDDYNLPQEFSKLKLLMSRASQAARRVFETEVNARLADGKDFYFAQQQAFLAARVAAHATFVSPEPRIVVVIDNPVDI